MRKLLLSFTLCLLSVLGAAASEVTFDLSTFGYTNQQVVTSATLNSDFTATFTKGGSNDPKYYTIGNAVRIYKSGGSVKVTAKAGAGITITAASFENTANSPATTVAMTVADDGQSASFSATETTRIHSITITYTGGSDTPTTQTVATPTFSPTSGTVDAGTQVSIACATPDAAILYGSSQADISTPYTGPITISETTTLWAKATKDGMNPSDEVSATYTVNAVTPPTPPAGDDDQYKWVLVTSPSQIALGNTYVITNSSHSVGMLDEATDDTNCKGTSVTYNATDKTLTPGDAVQLTYVAVTVGDSTYNCLQTPSGYYLHAGSSSKNQLKIESTAEESANLTEFSVTSSGVATIKFGKYTRNWLRYNSTNNANLFSCYSSGQNDISVFVKTAVGPVIPTAATPVISPDGGKIHPDSTISLSCATPGATISYRWNDSDTLVYSAPIPAQAGVLAAWATADGYKESAVATATFSLPVAPSTPEVRNGDTLLSGDQAISLPYNTSLTVSSANASSIVITDGNNATVLTISGASGSWTPAPGEDIYTIKGVNDDGDSPLLLLDLDVALPDVAVPVFTASNGRVLSSPQTLPAGTEVTISCTTPNATATITVTSPSPAPSGIEASDVALPYTFTVNEALAIEVLIEAPSHNSLTLPFSFSLGDFPAEPTHLNWIIDGVQTQYTYFDSAKKEYSVVEKTPPTPLNTLLTIGAGSDAGTWTATKANDGNCWASSDDAQGYGAHFGNTYVSDAKPGSNFNGGILTLTNSNIEPYAKIVAFTMKARTKSGSASRWSITVNGVTSTHHLIFANSEGNKQVFEDTAGAGIVGNQITLTCEYGTWTPNASSSNAPSLRQINEEDGVFTPYTDSASKSVLNYGIWITDIGLSYDFSEIPSGIENVSVADTATSPVDSDANALYFNLQGQRCSADALTSGIYIRRSPSSVTKVLIK